MVVKQAAHHSSFSSWANSLFTAGTLAGAWLTGNLPACAAERIRFHRPRPTLEALEFMDGNLEVHPAPATPLFGESTVPPVRHLDSPNRHSYRSLSARPSPIDWDQIYTFAVASELTHAQRTQINRARRLSDMAHPHLVPHVRTLLNDKSVAVREIGVKLLTYSPAGQPHLDILREVALNDASDSVANTALFELGLLQVWDQPPWFSNLVLEQSRSPRTARRAAACGQLGHVADLWSATTRLTELLDDVSPVVRMAAAASLIDATGEGAKPALRRVAQSDPNRQVRSTVRRLLERLR